MNIKNYLLRLWNFWPPFFFSGIRIDHRAKDYRYLRVRLKLRFWNANFVGTQYGGLIFSLTDPFYMIMLMKNLGDSYVIWDKSATIKFLHPGRTDLIAEFTLSEEDLKQIREEVEANGRCEWNRLVEVKNIHGEVVAEAHKVVSIKKKVPQQNA